MRGSILLFIIFLSCGRNSEIKDFVNLDTEDLKGLAKYDRPDLAQLHDFRITKDPQLGYPPIDRLIKIKNDRKSLSLARSESSSSAVWREKGPNNFGGRTRAIMFDPNDPFNKKLWAGSVAGGLWFNENIDSRSTVWENRGDDFNNLAVSSITHDPTNTNIYYLGTGEGWYNLDAVRGAGIWKSLDAGDTWQQLTSTIGEEFYYIQKVVVTDSGTVLAATRSGLYRSIDQGQNWDLIDGGRFADIEVTGSVIYASEGIFYQGTLYKSTDDGVTWEDITPDTSGQRIEIGVSKSNSDIVYAVASYDDYVAWFRKSNDQGVTWSNVSYPKYKNTACGLTEEDFTRGQAWYDLIISVGEDPNNVVIGGIDLHQSLNGGVTWNPISYWYPDGLCDSYVHADQHNALFKPGNDNILISSNDGGIYLSNNYLDASPIFEPRNNGYNVTQFYSCAMENTTGSNYFLAGAQDNGSHIFNGNGIVSTYEITGGDGAYTFIDQDNSDIQITSYVYNVYFVTKNGWDSYTILGDQNHGSFINPAAYYSEGDILFAAGDPGELLRYDLNNETITQEILNAGLDNAQLSSMTFSPFTSGTAFAGTNNGGVYRLIGIDGEGIASFDLSNGLIPSNTNVSSIQVGESDNHLVVTLSNYGVESVWETIDGGSTWVGKEGDLPDMPVRWCLIDPSNSSKVILATEAGIWETNNFSDENPNWSPQDFPMVRVDMLQYRDSDGMIAAATHGRGLFVSDQFAGIPVASFYSSTSVSWIDSSIEFNNESSGSSNYLWDFGDGESSSGVNPTHQYSSEGLYEVTLTADGNSVFSREIRVLPVLPTSFELGDGGDFEGDALFYAESLSGSNFERGSSLVNDKSGTNSGSNAWVLALNDDKYASNTEAYLYTPAFDFSLSGTYSMEFYLKYRIQEDWDGLYIEYSDDSGESWQSLGIVEDDWYDDLPDERSLILNPTSGVFNGQIETFERKSIDLSNFSGKGNVGFRFAFKSNGSIQHAGLAIDDFQIFGPTSSSLSVDFEISDNSCFGQTVRFENLSTGGITSYSWNFGESAYPESAQGFGPHEVIYGSTGEKTITMTAQTNGGPEVRIKELAITNPPDYKISSIDSQEDICDGDDITITVANSDVNVNYSLYSITSNSIVSASVAGNGQEIEITSEPIYQNSEIHVVGRTLSGCQSEVSELFEVNLQDIPAVEIIGVGEQLLAGTIGADYAWYLDGVLIEGVNTRLITPLKNGIYTVSVSINGCNALSDGFEVDFVLGITEGVDFHVFPNPVKSLLNIDLNNNKGIVNIYGMDGALRISKEVIGKFEFNTTGLSSGMYVIQISLENDRSGTLLVRKL